MTNIDNNVNIPEYGLPVGQIIESGSNDNGTYIKFSNGIMICLKSILFDNINITSALGNIFITDSTLNLGTYPQEFKDNPTTTVTINSGNNGWLHQWWNTR